MSDQKKAKRKTKREATKKHVKAPAKPNKQDTSTVVAYFILALLVIATSFWTGYLVGKTSMMTEPDTQNMEGELTITEFSDFECPFCGRAVPTVEQIKEEYPNVNVVFKQFPLESLHPNAINAAVASECVRRDHGEEAFWEYHDKLFANQQSLTADNLKAWATEMGYNINSCFDNKETQDTVNEHMAEGRAAGVRGTPSFLVGDELVVGAQPFSAFKPIIDAALSGEAPEQVAPVQPPAEVADVDVGSFVLGQEGAEIMIVEFTDYQCPFCKRAHDQSYPGVYENYIKTGKAQYTVRHFPLPFHTDAQKASEAVECAGEVGGAAKFWEMHEALFENQADLSVDALKGYAGNLGISQTEFDSCLDNGDFATRVADDLNAGREAGVSGTPSFFINGKKLVGAQPYSAFEAAIESELQ